MMNIRTTKPEAGNKYFTKKTSGGYSSCIQGKPTDKCDILANCVGYACGAFNEQLGLGCEKYHLTCNAEDFIERAIAMGLSVVKEPVKGGIMVWSKGRLKDGTDGAGHVEISCIDYIKGTTPSKDYTKIAASGWGCSKTFWTATRYRGEDGNWGMSKAYTYRGCIVPPNYEPDPIPEPTPKPEPTPTPKADFKVGDYVVPTVLVNWKGQNLRKWDDLYQIVQIDYRGAVLAAVRGNKRPIWAVLPLENIKKVENKKN